MGVIEIYIYEEYMGDLYTSNELLDYDVLYWKQHGESDSLIGYAETKEEAWNLLKNNTDGWDYDYIWNFINENFDDDMEE